ncbi:hypothetical protein DIPPA_04911 [Diplonema papillatum]|nr:hypothetical protein DIPPA_04911 [Diplonema papillatum]
MSQERSSSDVDRLARQLKELLREEADIDFTQQVNEARLHLDNSKEESAFVLGTLLVKQSDQASLKEGITILEQLSMCAVHRLTPECADLLGFPQKAKHPDPAADAQIVQYYYLIALAQYKMEDLGASISLCNKILRFRPSHSQTLALHRLATKRADEQKAKETMVGFGLAAVGVLAVGLLVYAAPPIVPTSPLTPFRRAGHDNLNVTSQIGLNNSQI